MHYCVTCQRHLNGALICPGCGASAPWSAPLVPVELPDSGTGPYADGQRADGGDDAGAGPQDDRPVVYADRVYAPAPSEPETAHAPADQRDDDHPPAEGHDGTAYGTGTGADLVPYPAADHRTVELYGWHGYGHAGPGYAPVGGHTPADPYPAAGPHPADHAGDYPGDYAYADDHPAHPALLPGAAVAPAAGGGLHPEDAYAVADDDGPATAVIGTYDLAGDRDAPEPSDDAYDAEDEDDDEPVAAAGGAGKHAVVRRTGRRYLAATLLGLAVLGLAVSEVGDVVMPSLVPSLDPEQDTGAAESPDPSGAAGDEGDGDGGAGTDGSVALPSSPGGTAEPTGDAAEEDGDKNDEDERGNREDEDEARPTVDESGAVETPPGGESPSASPSGPDPGESPSPSPGEPSPTDAPSPSPTEDDDDDDGGCFLFWCS
ncbi:SCO2400 family protein [Streptomyces sp. URMC 129]|uniref:SCO2400 family protein n=1 Tax=Streptomyces sp. URMC 129 TaxID=3423407 RepID=UPI003F1AED72